MKKKKTKKNKFQRILSVVIIMILIITSTVIPISASDNYSVYESEYKLQNNTGIQFGNFAFTTAPYTGGFTVYSGFEDPDIAYLQLPNGKPNNDIIQSGAYGGLQSSGTQIYLGEFAQYRYYLSTAIQNENVITYEYGMQYANVGYDMTMIPDRLTYIYELYIYDYSVNLNDRDVYDDIQFAIATNASVESIKVTRNLIITYPEKTITYDEGRYEIKTRNLQFTEAAFNREVFYLLPQNITYSYPSDNQKISGTIRIEIEVENTYEDTSLTNDHISKLIILMFEVPYYGNTQEDFIGGDWNWTVDINNTTVAPPSQDDINIIGWLIDTVDNTMEIELFAGLSLGNLMWFCIGIALLFVVLKMFRG